MTGKVQFVEQPATAPVVLLDVNSPKTDGMYVRGEDFELGAPQWDTEPGQVGGDDGYREVSFTVAVDQSYVNAASNMSALARVLQRRQGWLLMQRETWHPPMFLRWYRTTPQPLDWELWHINTYTLAVQLTCDPYLYGEPITLGPYTISNRPDSGTNRAHLDLAADTFVGDAPAPLRIAITPSVVWDCYQPLVSSTALAPGQTLTQPIYYDLTAAGWTAGGNTGADVADSAFVGGSYRLWTPASSAPGGALNPRVTGALSPAPVPGLYKALVRVQTTANNSTFALRLSQTYSGTQTYNGESRYLTRSSGATAAYGTWVDLGEFAFPWGLFEPDTTDIGAVTAPTVSIDGNREAGTSNLRLDALLLIPIETAATIDTVVSTWRFMGQGLSTTRQGVIDGQRQRFLTFESGSRAQLRTPEQRGGWPRGWPGVMNVFHVLQQTQVDAPFDVSAADNDVITDTCSLSISYMPRYLHLRP